MGPAATRACQDYALQGPADPINACATARALQAQVEVGPRISMARKERSATDRVAQVCSLLSTTKPSRDATVIL